MRIAVLALVAVLSTASLGAGERPRGPFVGVLLGLGATGCQPKPEDQGECLVANNVARAAGGSLGVEIGLSLDHGLLVALEAESLSDYDRAGSASRFGPSIRYAPLSWFWLGAGPLLGTMTASGGVASESGLGAQVGAGFELLLGRHVGLGLRGQHAWLGNGFSMLTFDLGIRWQFRRD